MKPITVCFTDRHLEMYAEITDYHVHEDGEVDILEYTIYLDWQFFEHHKFDAVARLVIGMLADGTHLQDKVLEDLHDDQAQWAMVAEELITHWNKEMQEDAENYSAAEEDYYSGLEQDRKMGLI